MGTKQYTSARYLACALLAALAVAGCTGSPPAGQPATSTPVPHKTSPADVCANLVSYWAKETVNGGKWSGLDWEQKGLSNEQYAIHEEILAAARAEEKRQGRPAALKLIDLQARQKCTAQNGATGSSENWRPPK
ncbi:hypothetical protein HRW23_16360 [Streptomyces lunaelactis]|uniref:hypothetical protein n=1 Tax=Streptomyces lunaelactis TaxID=1535768 RepID=UPI001584B367|nr:hypothetical protein [Streptomyces lunaelactis]NUK07904.1 hypothetical protein [Streptomyces lunaelactis]NUK25905.1 hypothetical protein [Streptomyces lunaelactis]NUK33893.1 hypothetical protein [Streptomyces lunaelactis]NUK43904.1 hypothetical protein [Streptomyces lunaelactis]NUK49759.1 hypothetical protein [Streptomyces lunaelactis]